MPRPFDAQLRSELPADGFTTNALVTITLAISYDRFPIHSSYKIKYRDNFIRAFVALPGRHMAVEHLSCLCGRVMVVCAPVCAGKN